MSENRYWAAFGLEEPKAEGAKEQEVADPAANVEAGAKEQDVADPVASYEAAENENLNSAEEPATSDTDPAGNPAQDGKKEQDAETRRQNAAKRREQEAAQLRAQIEAEVQAKYNDRLKAAAAGLKLRGAGENANIASLEDLEALAQSSAMQKAERELGQGKLSKESLQAVLMSTPGVKEALESARISREQAEAATKAANQSKYQADMQQQLAEIRKLDPKIKSVDDVIKMETGPAFAGYVRMGISPAEAYKLANHDSIVAKARSAGEQAARNAAAGKQHLTPASAGVKTGFEVTDAMRKQYRRFVPDVTDAEIAKIEAERRKAK